MNRLLMILFLIPALGLVEESRGQIRMPAIFSDHMVLQREMNLPVWGTAKAGSKVTVEIAGEDMKFYKANASVVENKVVVLSAEVSSPVAVRYAWANSPVANLRNREGLPASPFRTDSCKGVTDDKY